MNEIYHTNCIDAMTKLAPASIDCIVTDPPYGYLKNQKLDVAFDEEQFFFQCKRVLKKNAFIIIFGRGSSFYRWNTMIDALGFVFKEEIVWNKTQNSSPVTPINRVHETISIYAQGNASIGQSFIPYTEIKTNPDQIINDIKRIKVAINNKYEFDDLMHYLQTGEVKYRPEERTLGKNTTVQTQMSQQSRVVKAMQAIKRGLKEKSIIDVNRDHYSIVHPTQKPIRLIERLLLLTTKRGDLILDPFAGSGSTALAAINLGRQFLTYEIDEEYYNEAKKRIDHAKLQKDFSLNL
jgi:site-specific DNA-methyltransferase (adenine-specific)